MEISKIGMVLLKESVEFSLCSRKHCILLKSQSIQRSLILSHALMLSLFRAMHSKLKPLLINVDRSTAVFLGELLRYMFIIIKYSEKLNILHGLRKRALFNSKELFSSQSLLEKKNKFLFIFRL